MMMMMMMVMVVVVMAVTMMDDDDDDDDDDDELGYSVLNLISGITIPSAASAVLSEHTDSQL